MTKRNEYNLTGNVFSSYSGEAIELSMIVKGGYKHVIGLYLSNILLCLHLALFPGSNGSLYH